MTRPRSVGRLECLSRPVFQVSHCQDFVKFFETMPPKKKKEKASTGGNATTKTDANENSRNSDDDAELNAVISAKNRGDGLWYLVFALIFAVLAVVVPQYLHASYRRSMMESRFPTSSSSDEDAKNTKTTIHSKYWKTDEDFENEYNNNMRTCDFKIFDASQDSSLRNSRGEFVLPEKYASLQYPFVIRNLIDKEWQAFDNDKWQPHKLIREYGKHVISSDSQVSIVQGGGKSDMKFNSLSKIIREMREAHVNNSKLIDGTDDINFVQDSFTFDASILNSIPALQSDFLVPQVFDDWMTDPRVKEGNAWHIFSLGASRTGLPFHTHGKTYLGLVHGMKRWFVYPPGTAAPESIMRDTNPLQTVHYWLHHIYPLFEEGSWSKPDIYTDYTTVERNDDITRRGYAPLECTQEAGDLLFLPAAYSHQTINIGESIGVGAQDSMSVSEKYTLSEDILDKDPSNLDALKMRGLAAAHIGMTEESRVKYNISATTRSGMVKLSPTSKYNDFYNLISESEDTWVVKYFMQGAKSPHVRDKAQLWNTVAQKLKGIVSVGSAEIPSYRFNKEEHDYVMNKHQLKDLGVENEGYDVEDPNTWYPVIRIFWGRGKHAKSMRGRRHKTNDPDYGDSTVYDNTELDISAMITGSEYYEGVKEEDVIVDYILDQMVKLYLDAGSATTVGVIAHQYYHEAITALDRARVIQPLNYEIHSLLAEVYGLKNQPSMVKETIEMSRRTFDPIASKLLEAQHSTTLSRKNPLALSNSVSLNTMASVYHKLAEVYLAQENGEEALLLLENALSLLPSYGPALIDRVMALVLIGNKEAEIHEAVAQAEAFNIKRTHPKLRQILEFMLSSTGNNNNNNNNKGWVQDQASKKGSINSQGRGKPPPKRMSKKKIETDRSM